MLWCVIALLLAALIGVVLVRTLRFQPRTTEPVKQVLAEVDAERAARNLSALVQCRTISHANPAEDDAAEFDRLESILPSLYPNVHRICERELLPQRAMIYRWKGYSAENPLVLTAHYDVVAVDESAWSKPPFSGSIEEGAIWGRGTLDTKCTLAAMLDAAEDLIAEGFQPSNDIYFCFGGNEEVSGGGAAAIVDTLEKRGVKPRMVLDEGGAIVEKVFPGVRKPCALIGVAEKGNVNYELAVHSDGGHASAPPRWSPVDRLARACMRLHDKPFPMRVTKPAALMLDALPRESNFAYRMIFANLWLFAPVLDRLCRKSGGELNALLRTTLAFTRMRGSDAANVIPTTASLTINARILPGETVEGIRAAMSKRIADEHVEVRYLYGTEPSSRTSELEEMRGLAVTIREIYPDVLVAPYLMIAGSDARRYERICSSVYRFSGMPLSGEERRMIHGMDEHIPVAKQADAVRFFRRVLQSH